MMQRIIHRFTVEGSGSFPFDMLCRERAWPTSSKDAAMLELHYHRELRKIELSTFSMIPLNYDLWKSLNWKVIKS